MTTKCPTPVEFETYLKKTGSKEFMDAFENHLHQCEFCTEAIDGYRQNNLLNVKMHSVHLKQTYDKRSSTSGFILKKWAYAASIATLATISILYLQHQTKNITRAENNADTESNVISNSFPSTGTKRLMNISGEQYWYLGQNQKVAINDAFIPSAELEKAMQTSPAGHTIIVEIQNQDYQFSHQIVDRLKQNQKAPVFTVSTRKEVSPFKKPDKL